jgi:toxin ParE1/3/4
MALDDLDAIRINTIEQFGEAAEDHYRDLLETAVDDLCADPDRADVKALEGAADGVRYYHIRNSRRRGARRIGNPRHYIIFRATDDTLDILRVLHDAMDILAHLSGEE